MTRVERIKHEIEALPPEEQMELAEWLYGGDDDEWDRQMKEDAKAGRLDPLIEEARREIAEGKGMPLPGDPDAPSADTESATDASSKT